MLSPVRFDGSQCVMRYGVCVCVCARDTMGCGTSDGVDNRMALNEVASWFGNTSPTG
uniref:Uncharacterized protein n=1 Tax=Trypanosoma brucei TaxID=5691 RepID=Q582Y9_9TRYP|nr:hypothetical protein, unlikely [Trypanosoma brucei]